MEATAASRSVPERADASGWAGESASGSCMGIGAAVSGSGAILTGDNGAAIVSSRPPSGKSSGSLASMGLLSRSYSDHDAHEESRRKYVEEFIKSALPAKLRVKSRKREKSHLRPYASKRGSGDFASSKSSGLGFCSFSLSSSFTCCRFFLHSGALPDSSTCGPVGVS